jgi:tetratricopeptide (TPR) repeat protein
MQTFKLFVSSPGDVMVERRRVENVVSRLNGEFAGVARLEAIRWETEFYQAYSTFQAQIPRSTDCDLVIGILRWRLGTELPLDFAERLPGDKQFPSGTAYEILTAIEQRQKGGRLPDVYVFRFAGGSPPVPLDDPNRATIERNWLSLKTFFEEWFLTAGGHFKAAFNQYGSEDDFEAQLEKLLRKWVADKVASGRVVRWPTEVKGSPFCGLSAFGAKHAPVFFGRGNDVSRAVDLWREAGSRGSPYLLVVGASGSGKSSLARAGLVPRLTTPGVIKEVDAWRVAVMRPGDSAAGPFAALAAALMQDEAALPKEEEGRGPALPEICQGDSQTPAELAAVLQHADAAAVKPIVNALSRVGAAEHSRERYSREVRCDLVMLIDQFEELFTASMSEAERNTFIGLIAALVGTGRVWVVATLRADFYAGMLVQPGLKKLKELGATYDLAPPGPVELAEIVRAPAEAAGLVFESDAATGEQLDARLLRDADRPDMLPLVQLALSRLFEGRETAGGQIMLLLKVYDGLGGLKGIVNEAGEKALASLGEAEKAQLPRLLRQLAIPAHEQDGVGKGALTIRAVPLSQVAPDGDEPAHKLVASLIDARLLTTTGTAADAQVRLTHQRVLEDWSRARAIVAESADFYRIRSDLEESRRKWEAGKRRNELLLPRGLPLAEAANIVGKFGGELTPEALAYVRASHQRAQRGQLIAWGVAAVFFVLAIGAGIAAKVAVDQRAQADAARTQAVHATHDAAMRLEELGDDKSKQGDLAGALADYQGSLVTFSEIAAQYHGDAQAQHDVSTCLIKMGDVKLQQGDLPAALTAYNQSLDAARHAGNDSRAQHDLATSLNKFGDAAQRLGDIGKAREAFQESSTILRELVSQAPDSAQAQRDLAQSQREIGDVDLIMGDYLQALASYQEGLEIDRMLLARDTSDEQTQRDVFVSMGRIARIKNFQGDRAGALAAYQGSVDVARELAKQNSTSAEAQRDLSLALQELGMSQLAANDALAAFHSYEESLTISRKIAQDQISSDVQRDISTSLIRFGDVQLRQDDAAGALASYQESLEIDRRLAARDPNDMRTQLNLEITYNKIGREQVAQGKLADALTSYQAGLPIIERLTKSDPGNANWQHDLAASYARIADVYGRSNDPDKSLAALRDGQAIVERLAKLSPGDTELKNDLVWFNNQIAALTK